MKDKQRSEEEIFKDLDTMYKRVADVEKEEAAEAAAEAVETEAVETEAAETTLQKKAKPQPKKKQPSGSSRRPIIIAFIGILVLAFVSAMTVFKPMIIQLIPGMSETSPAKVVTPPTLKAKPFTKPSAPPPAVLSDKPPAPVPVPKEQEAVKATPKEQEALKPTLKEQEPAKTTPKEVEKTKPLLQETTKSEKPLTQEKYYAIQVGAFQNLEYARDLMESLKKNGLDAYWISQESKKRGTLYKVFVGHFTDKNEADQYLKEQKTFNNYPGSYPRRISSPKMNPQ